LEKYPRVGVVGTQSSSLLALDISSYVVTDASLKALKVCNTL
jgi:hypothetical protein